MLEQVDHVGGNSQCYFSSLWFGDFCRYLEKQRANYRAHVVLKNKWGHTKYWLLSLLELHTLCFAPCASFLCMFLTINSCTYNPIFDGWLKIFYNPTVQLLCACMFMKSRNRRITELLCKHLQKTPDHNSHLLLCYSKFFMYNVLDLSTVIYWWKQPYSHNLHAT